MSVCTSVHDKSYGISYAVYEVQKPLDRFEGIANRPGTDRAALTPVLIQAVKAEVDQDPEKMCVSWLESCILTKQLSPGSWNRVWVKGQDQ